MTGQALIDAAVAFAQRAHADQTRADKRTPYVHHPQAVAGLFAGHWGCDAAWAPYIEGLTEHDYAKGVALCHLHDVWEDTEASLADMRRAGLGELEDEMVLLTRGRDQSYLAYLLAIRGYRHVSILPWLVKLCDIEHNEGDSIGLPRARRKWALTKYELARYVLTHP